MLLDLKFQDGERPVSKILNACSMVSVCKVNNGIVWSSQVVKYKKNTGQILARGKESRSHRSLMIIIQVCGQMCGVSFTKEIANKVSLAFGTNLSFMSEFHFIHHLLFLCTLVLILRLKK